MRMKAMKRSMKTKKAAKKSRKMKKRVSKVQKGRGRKARVFSGKKEKTSGGLKKSDLIRNNSGRVVSKKQHLQAKRGVIGKWGNAVKKQRSALKIKGFCPIGGKTVEGQRLLKNVRIFFK